MCRMIITIPAVKNGKSQGTIYLVMKRNFTADLSLAFNEMHVKQIRESCLLSVKNRRQNDEADGHTINPSMQVMHCLAHFEDMYEIG
jgi:hypothetical protein